MSSVASVIRQVLGGQQDEDEDYLEENEESGEASGAGAENDSFHVDIAEDSFLDWVFNIIPDTVNSITGGEEYDYEYVYDEDNRQGMNISTKVGLLKFRVCIQLFIALLLIYNDSTYYRTQVMEAATSVV